MVVAARLCHSSVLWADDNLPLAAAMEVWRGKTLYRDVWFDKPALVAWVYLLWGARAGIALRLAGAAYVLAVSAAAYKLAALLWSRNEGLLAAIFSSFFLTFALPSAVIPLASDMLLILPHLAAIYFAWRGKAFWSGAAAGIGLLCSSKAIFVLAACALWLGVAQWPLLLAGFIAPNAIALSWMWAHGSAADYYRQAWQWGSIYAANSFIENPLLEALKRTGAWLGFQSALVVGAILALRRERDWRWIAWIVLAFIGVVLGLRFFPRYYFLLLPPLILLAARGWTSVKAHWALAILLLIPLVRFAPAYLTVVRDPAWRDLDIDRDSRAAAAKLRSLAAPGDTLFVWGFRPDIFIDSGLPAGTRFLESQAISGVLADRHLFSATPVHADFLDANRAELTASRPTWVVDGLGPYNPALALDRQDYLNGWMSHYQEAGRTKFSILYRLK